MGQDNELKSQPVGEKTTQVSGDPFVNDGLDMNATGDANWYVSL